MKKLLLLLLLGAFIGCNDIPTPEPEPEPPPVEDPEPPPPEPEPDPEPEPPPVSEADPDLYVPMRLVEGLINGTGVPVEENAINHGMVWGAGRAFRDAANNCPWSCNDPDNLFFGLTCQEMHEIHARSIELYEEGERMIVKLRKENRRCNPEHRLYDPRFIDAQGRCRRSEVRWEVYREFRSRHDAHLNEAAELTAIAGACQDTLQRFGGNGYDTIGGWCGSANKARSETGFNALLECP